MWEFVFTHHEYFVFGKMVVKRLTDVLHRSFRIRCNDVLNGYWSVESAEKFTGTFTGYRNYKLSLQEHVTGIWLPNPEIWLPNPWSVTLTVICDIDKKIFNSSHHLIHNLSLISPFDIRSSGSSFYPNIYYNFYRSDDFPNNLPIWNMTTKFEKHLLNNFFPLSLRTRWLINCSLYCIWTSCRCWFVLNDSLIKNL